MKIKLLTLMFFNYVFTFSQVGIGTSEPHAQLEISKTSSNIADGVLIPRISGDKLKLKNNLYNADQEGVLLYVTEPLITTGVSGDKTENIIIEGFYYFDGNYWVNIANENEDIANKTSNNIYNNDGVLNESRTVSGGDYTLRFVANNDNIKNNFNVDTLFTVDTQSDRIGLQTFSPAAKFNIADTDISSSILNLNVLSPATVLATDNEKLIPLLIDNNGYIVKNGVIEEVLNRTDSYSVNAKYNINDGNQHAIFTRITKNTVITFTFGTNYGFATDRSGLIYGEVTFSILNGFNVTSWAASGRSGFNVTLDTATANEITFKYNSGPSLKFLYSDTDGTLYATRMQSTSSSVILTIWDGLKLR